MWHPWGRVLRRTAVKKFLVARISVWRVVACCFALFASRVGVWGQVGETLVRLQDPAAGKFPSGKRLMASDGFSALAETRSSSPTRRLPLALTRHTLAP